MTVNFDPKVIQDQCRDALLADPAFTITEVISADPGDLETQINEALSRIGIAAFVLVPALHVNKPNLPGPYFDNFRIAVEIAELPLTNRDPNSNPNYTTATTLAFVVAGILHHFAPVGINERLYVTDVLNVEDPTKTMNIWHVELSGSAGVKYAMPQIAPVTASSLVPGPVTLGCATPGAPIWFTRDKSYPSPRNPNAQIYLPYAAVIGTNNDGSPLIATEGGVLIATDVATVQPLVMNAGERLLARAWLAGYAPSTPDLFSNQY